MKNIKYFFKTYYLTMIVAIIILLLSVLRFDKVSEKISFELADKVVHFIMYFFLCTVLLLNGSRYHKKQLSILYLIWSGIIVILYGVLMEFLQYFISYRGASLYDMLANSFGVIFAIICFIFVSTLIFNGKRK